MSTTNKHLTRNQIAYNLRVSPHMEIVNYGEKEVTFVFSSDLYRRKFNERREEMRKQIEEVLTRRYKVRADVTELADVQLYKQIEKRGFLIYHNDEEATCLEHLKFVGRITT